MLLVLVSGFNPYRTINIDALNCVLGAGNLSWLSLHYSSESIMQKLRIIVETSATEQSNNVVEWILFSSVIPYCQFLCDGVKALLSREGWCVGLKQRLLND